MGYYVNIDLVLIVGNLYQWCGAIYVLFLL